MTRDDRDSVNSVIEALGEYGALCYAHQRLANPIIEPDHIRRMMILIINDVAPRVRDRAKRARFLARCHAQGLKQKDQTYGTVQPHPRRQRANTVSDLPRHRRRVRPRI
jgi:hypothetical protein